MALFEVTWSVRFVFTRIIEAETAAEAIEESEDWGWSGAGGCADPNGVEDDDNMITTSPMRARKARGRTTTTYSRYLMQRRNDDDDD